METRVSLRYWVPLVSALPLNTFPQRLIRKWFHIGRDFILFLCNRLEILGATIVGTSSSGNTLLRLNKNYPLGRKGSILEIPLDRAIFQYVKNRGYWELAESKFLARGLMVASRLPGTKTALIDIGANTGLVTLQAMNLSSTNNEVFLFEPIPRHASAISHNLRNLRNIHVNEFALSDRNDEAEIYTEAFNHGNTSTLKSIVPEIGMVTTKIRMVETRQYCVDFLNNFDKYVIKCDTQGMDALILSRFPEQIWKKCESAVIEVWPLDSVNKLDVENLLFMCQDFDYISWHPNADKSKKIDLLEVSEFWLGKSGSQRNLFLSKSY